MSNIIVRNDEMGELDEIIATGANVHLERMDEHWFCLIIEQGGRRLLVNVGTSDDFVSYRPKVNATIYADETND